MNWKERVVELVLVQQELRAVDTAGLWEHHLPSVAATGDELAALEAHLGEPLDSQYRDFLGTAGGWRAFIQAVDLFGPADLRGGPRWARAVELLGYLEDSVLKASGVAREDVIPIAVSSVDIELHVMTRRCTSAPGTVIWFDGAEVERYPSFVDFYAAMVDYNRYVLQKLLEDKGR